ncbi:hypothetical protein WJ542_27115 [Paraburkholderia sp. B3]|uniref:hypothetical protein n=1 Tax=Paraburkholderia sp. B3 TaxID=3134791 RepID=UPI003982BCAC
MHDRPLSVFPSGYTTDDLINELVAQSAHIYSLKARVRELEQVIRTLSTLHAGRPKSARRNFGALLTGRKH